LSFEEAGSEKKKKKHFFCLRDWGLFTAVEWRREEGGEGLQSRPTSPAPITQAEKTIFFFFFLEPASSKLNGHLTLVNSLSAMDGHDRPLKN
jgi:hypothetical protein